MVKSSHYHASTSPSHSVDKSSEHILSFQSQQCCVLVDGLIDKHLTAHVKYNLIIIGVIELKVDCLHSFVALKKKKRRRVNSVADPITSFPAKPQTFVNQIQPRVRQEVLSFFPHRRCQIKCIPLLPHLTASKSPHLSVQKITAAELPGKAGLDVSTPKGTSLCKGGWSPNGREGSSFDSKTVK